MESRPVSPSYAPSLARMMHDDVGYLVDISAGDRSSGVYVTTPPAHADRVSAALDRRGFVFAVIDTENADIIRFHIAERRVHQN